LTRASIIPENILKMDGRIKCTAMTIQGKLNNSSLSSAHTETAAGETSGRRS
jgi:hypothetical protein